MQHLPHQLTTNVKLLQKVAVSWQNQVLLLKRAADAVSRPDCWDLPGGNSEWPTQPDQVGWGQLRHDALREVIEETGITLDISQFEISRLIFLDTYFDKPGDVFSVVAGWHVPLTMESKPVINLSHEHALFAWVKLEELEGYYFGGERGEFVKQMVLLSYQS